MFIETNLRTITLSYLLICIMLMCTTFFSSCEYDKDFVSQFVGNYHFITIEINHTGTHCVDTIIYNGTIKTNGINKLIITFKLSNSSPCNNTRFKDGLIYSNVDAEGNLSNSDFVSNFVDHFTGKIENTGDINLEVVEHYGLGGYFRTKLIGNKM